MGTFNVMKGYGYIHHNGKMILLHRLAWYLMTGSFPEVQIYHLNGDKSDNRIENLTLETRETHNRKHGNGRLYPC